MLPWKHNALVYHQRLIIWHYLNWPDSLFYLSPSHFPLKDHTLSQVSQQNIELLPSASDSRGVILLFKSGLLNKNHTEIYTERTALVQILPGSVGGSFLTAPFLVKRGWAGSRQSFCACQIPACFQVFRVAALASEGRSGLRCLWSAYSTSSDSGVYGVSEFSVEHRKLPGWHFWSSGNCSR